LHERSHARAIREERVNTVLDFLRATECGTATRAELLAHHPDLAYDLTAFLNDRDSVLRIAAPLLHATLPAPSGFGDYEHLEEIGRGAFGIVYRARQVSANRAVALKMILEGCFASEGEVRRFRREAEMTAQLDHPHIVPVYEVGQHDGRPFFSMKLVEGGALRDHLDRFRNDPRAAAQLVARLAHAVHHAHQRGLLHRDLKPGNVLLSPAKQAEPIPLVTDFGLAR
jgi:serine/threonine-protein kinase